MIFVARRNAFDKGQEAHGAAFQVCALSALISSTSTTLFCVFPSAPTVFLFLILQHNSNIITTDDAATSSAK